MGLFAPLSLSWCLTEHLVDCFFRELSVVSGFGQQNNNKIVRVRHTCHLTPTRNYLRRCNKKLAEKESSKLKMLIYIHMYTHVCMLIHTCIYTHVSIHTYTHVCVYRHTHTHTHTLFCVVGNHCTCAMAYV